MIDPEELEADAKKPVGDANQAVQKGEELLQLYRDMNKLLREAEGIKKRIETIECKELPEIMEACNLPELKFNNGLMIEIKDIVKAALPTQTAIDKEKDEDKKSEKEHKRRQGLAWLRETKNGSLIKNTLALEFSSGKDNIVGDFIGKAEELDIPYSRQENVAPQSLSKLVKEMMEKGIEVPKDTLGVYCGKRAAVKKSG